MLGRKRPRKYRGYGTVTAHKRPRIGAIRKGVGFYKAPGLGAVGIETKFHDGSFNFTTATGGTIEDSIIEIPQGTTEKTRIGRKAFIKSIHMRMNTTLGAFAGSTAPPDDTIRILVYMDKQCNGTAATALQILETATIHSFRNLANSDRFQILMDKTHTMRYAGGSGDGAANDYGVKRAFFQKHIKLHMPVHYDLTAGAITEIRSNNIGVFVIGTEADMTFAMNYRIRFTD